MRRINGKLTAADRSVALFLLAHNPKVAGSIPELGAQRRHLLALEQAGDKPES
jgi:hypothetical protein